MFDPIGKGPKLPIFSHSASAIESVYESRSQYWRTRNMSPASTRYARSDLMSLIGVDRKFYIDITLYNT